MPKKRLTIVATPAILLDEPFSALDESLRQTLRHELSEVQSLMDIPMILISHNPDDVKYFGNDIIEMADGHKISVPI